ncbi:MAG: hypothetical protein AAGN35_06030 [Bacteroidota bacterium]
MKKQDYVFQLIKSLTRGEKRNFRMLGQLTSGSKKYLKLFDCMDGMDAYDEAKILKKFRKDPSFEKQFAYNKNYLYNAILNSLAYFHKGSNAEISSLTLQVEILMQKNLYDQARKLLRKVKERVSEQEKFEDLLKLYRFEVEILRYTENYKILHESLRRVEFEEKVALEKISNLLLMRRLAARSEVLFATIGMARHEDDLRRVQEICAFPEMESEEQALSIRAKILYNQIMRRVHHHEDDHRGALPFVERAIELYEANPGILADEKSTYLKMLGAAVNHSFNQFGLDEASKRLDKILELKVNTPQERLFKFTRGYLFYMAMFSDEGRKAPDSFIEEFDQELEKMWKEIPPSTKLFAMYALMTYHHIQGNHSKALKASNELLNQPRNGVSTPMQAAARIYNLVIHFELGNLDLIEYNLKSTSRFIFKIGRMFKFERRVLRFFSRVINLSTKEEERAEMQSLRDDLVEIVKDPFEAKAYTIFRAIEWLDAKLEGVPFAETIQRKALAKYAEAETAAEKEVSESN